MYARIVTLVSGGNLDRVLRIIEQTVIPAAERQDGFNAFVVMSNREADKIVSTSYWASRVEMLASEEQEYFQEQISTVITFLSAPPSVERFEVNALS